MFKGYNIMKFCKTFNTDNDCFNYLTDIKWENGFTCPNVITRVGVKRS